MVIRSRETLSGLVLPHEFVKNLKKKHSHPPSHHHFYDGAMFTIPSHG